MRIRKLPRRRLHREFCLWLRECGGLFKHRPCIFSRDDRAICWRFQGITDALVGILTVDQIWVAVRDQGEDVDYLLNLDCIPRKEADGYRCHFSHEDEIVPAASREEFWRHQLFEPLLDWINESLARSDAIELVARADGFSAAGLIRISLEMNHARREVFTIPLRSM